MYKHNKNDIFCITVIWENVLNCHENNITMQNIFMVRKYFLLTFESNMIQTPDRLHETDPFLVFQSE